MPALDQLFSTIENYDHPNLILYLSVRPTSHCSWLQRVLIASVA